MWVLEGAIWLYLVAGTTIALKETFDLYPGTPNESIPCTLLYVLACILFGPVAYAFDYLSRRIRL